jgi:hypothetical protein
VTLYCPVQLRLLFRLSCCLSHHSTRSFDSDYIKVSLYVSVFLCKGQFLVKEVKVCGEMCVLSLICSYVVRLWVTVYYISFFGIFYSRFIYRIIRFISFRSLLCFNYSFYVLLFVLFLFELFCIFCSLFCEFCVLVSLCIFSPYLYSCFFSICVQVYEPLTPGRHPTAVNKYRIIIKNEVQKQWYV